MSHQKLSSAATLLLILFSFLSSSASASAFNITRILNNFPEYSTFNDLLTRTGLAPAINQRSTITVLAVANGNIGDLSGKPIETVESVLRTHVVLDYFDLMKLNRLKDHTSKLTTMYQASGLAAYNQGFLNVTSGKDGVIFGSAVKNAPHDARLEGSVMSRPYNISVLSISHPIVTPGLDGSALPPSPPPPPATPAPAPAPAKKKAAKTPVEAPAPAAADVPAPAADVPAPAADAPDADAPDADSPAASPADAPDADEAADDKKSSSAAAAGGASFGGLLVVVLSALVAAQ